MRNFDTGKIITQFKITSNLTELSMEHIEGEQVLLLSDNDTETELIMNKMSI
jgi:hypothetical protein